MKQFKPPIFIKLALVAAAIIAVGTIAIASSSVIRGVNRNQQAQYERQSQTYKTAKFPPGYTKIRQDKGRPSGEDAGVYTEYMLSVPAGRNRRQVTDDLAAAFPSYPSPPVLNSHSNEYSIRDASGHTINVLFSPYYNGTKPQPEAIVTSVTLTLR